MKININLDLFKKIFLYFLLVTLGLSGFFGLLSGLRIGGDNLFVVIPIIIFFLTYIVSALKSSQHRLNILLLTFLLSFSFLMSEFALLIQVHEIRLPASYRYFFNVVICLGAFYFFRNPLYTWATKNKITFSILLAIPI